MKIKRSLALVLSVLLMMTAVIPAAFAASEELDRLAGADRFKTAVAIAKEGWETAEVVVLANGLKFPDALAGVPLAAALDAPILLTGPASLNADTAAAIEALKTKKVVILGGEAAVSAAVETELKDMGLTTERLAGDGRHGTAVKIANKLAAVLGVEKFKTAVVVFDGNFPDALAAASYAAINKMPIFLTGTNAVHSETEKALKALGVEEILVIGGKNVISEDVEKALKATRIAGDDRFETSVALAEHFGLKTDNYFIATGGDFADAIAGAALAAKVGTGILLVGNALPVSVREFLYSGKVMDAVVFGGDKAVSTTVLNNIFKNLFDPYVINVEGITALTKANVSITFHPLAGDLEEATIEVIDNKGNIIEVKPVNLVVNETETTFVFIKELAADPEGIWTIHGYEYDVDTVNILAAINAAVDPLVLYNLLIKYGFDNVVVANAMAYMDAKEDLEDEFVTLAEIQEFIDEVNETVETGSDQAALVKALKDAVASKNKALVIYTLAPWERVNSAYIDFYLVKLETTGYFDTATFKGIQTDVDTINNGKATDAVGDALSLIDTDAKVREAYNAAVKALTFVKEDNVEKKEHFKKDLQVLLQELDLVIKVKEATTAAQVANAYNALVAYYDEDTAPIGTEPFFTALRDSYRLKLDDVKPKDAAGIEAVIVAVNNAKREALYNDLADISDADPKTTTATVLARLKAFASFVDEDDFDIADVHTSTSRLERYRTELAKLVKFGEVGAPADLDTAIGLVASAIGQANDDATQAPLDAIKGFVTTGDDKKDAADLLVLLKNAELALGNVLDANADAYLTELSYLQNAADIDRASLKTEVEYINQTRIIANATSAADAREALGYVALEFGVDDYTNLKAAQKTEVAALFINDAKWGADKFTGFDREVDKLKDYTLIDHVETDLYWLAEKYTAVLDEINLADTIIAMKDALSKLDYKPFDDLTAAQKIDVADAFLENFPVDEDGNRIDYVTFAAIQAAIDAAK